MVNVNFNSEKVFIVGAVAKKVSRSVCLVPANNGIGAYYHMGIKVEGVYVNLHFYGLKQTDIGHTHAFNVEVWEKKVNKNIYSFLNFYKIEEKPCFGIKFNVEDGDVGIQGTKRFIYFPVIQKSKTVNAVLEEVLV
jgi:hypothetical protein